MNPPSGEFSFRSQTKLVCWSWTKHTVSRTGEHDFRPDYRRLVNVLRQLPPNMPLLGTTAAANNRVIEDVRSQLGDIEIQRGTLVRDGLVLQTLRLRDQASRLAWLAQHIHYANVEPRTLRTATVTDNDLEDRLLRNEIKTLVATTALGMGYDKPAFGFVIHYQAPGSVVGYYQQVGHAGRGIDMALLNLRHGQIDKVLKVLSIETPAPLIKEGNRWYRPSLHYAMDHERIRRLTEQREREWQEILEFVDSRTCLVAFLRQALDDPEATEYGECAVCWGEPVVEIAVDRGLAGWVIEAGRFTGVFREYGFRGNFPKNLQAEEGRILSRWGDAGWGGPVADGEHAGHFWDELVEAVAEMSASGGNPTRHRIG